MAPAKQVQTRPDDAPPSRLHSLQGMRFIAAGLVFAFHAIMYENLFVDQEAQGTFGALARSGGWTGVSFFFILSGFVLTWSYRPNDRFTTFWRRRVSKIYPNHVVTFLVAAALLTWVPSVASQMAPHHPVPNLLLIQAWWPDLSVIYTFNVVSWSLACEMFFYLSFPVLILFVSRIRPERLWLWLGIVVAVIFAVPTVSAAVPHGGVLSNDAQLPVVDLTAWEQWTIAVLPPVRMLEFVFGMLLARLVRSGRGLPLGMGSSVALAVVVYVLTPLVPGPYRIAATMLIPLGLIIANGAIADVERRPTWVSSRGMVWLGGLSYAFYLCHWLAIIHVHYLLGTDEPWSTPAAVGVLALIFGTALAGAWLLYSLVERPFMRRFGGSRRREATVESKEDVRVPTTIG